MKRPPRTTAAADSDTLGPTMELPIVTTAAVGAALRTSMELPPKTTAVPDGVSSDPR